MENDENDVHMIDIPSTLSSRTNNSNFSNGYSTMSRPRNPESSPMGSTSVNGFLGTQTASIPFSDDVLGLSAPKQAQDASREASILAQNTSNLSIENMKPAQEQFELFLSDLEQEQMEEHEPPAPFLAELPTGYCYDVRMRYHCELEPPKDRRDYHPEDPRRIFAIYKELCVAGLIDDNFLSQGALVPKPLRRIDVRQAAESEIELVHDQKHWEMMKLTTKQDAQTLIEYGYNLDSVYLNGITFECAKLSAGGAIETARAVACGLVKNAIAIIRPPGHHAECNRPMGFCIFDNVSIATKVCHADFPDMVRKTLILDWDVHHGNGIQQAFYQDPNVLYISIHVHEDGTFYPAGPGGDHLHCGAGPGLGKNINIPWPTKGMADADYIYAFQQIVMPVAYEFDPDLVMIAAGFDAADGDQLGGCFVTPACYAHMTHMLKSLAGGKVVVSLEGGYNLRSIARSALAVTRTLNGETPPRLEDRQAATSAITIVQKVRTQQSRYWSCLYPKQVEQGSLAVVGGERMHDVLRGYQAAQMKEKLGMINLRVLREKLSSSFENELLATPNFEEDIPLVIIFHDPPDLTSNKSGLDGQLELRSTFLTDSCKHYTSWSADQGYGVIDVNIPSFLTDLEAEGSDDEVYKRVGATQELATYIWDNYIEPNDHPQVFFIGIGAAYQGIMYLLNTRENFHTLVTGMINFIPSAPAGSEPSTNGTQNAIIPASDQSVFHLSKWYRANSLNFVGNTHLVWSPDRIRKPRYVGGASEGGGGLD
ncbi:uncharacterized protein KY384_000192 [Bacidia gigantensis]|uniref:uncharacterized protein n=1 Tax=Bacidia gigantensis TaxID=2732470 RepID=UPI001D048523|nr:uncharacterized protein KY384_000192 [Bacidia gigantensis]KAG8526199.1 hypothetical protein KY384_000192 [Bacidia gigantensis]